jgi:SAM-dependent methyltransferase
MDKKKYYNNFNKEYYTSDGYDDYYDSYIKHAKEITIPTIEKFLNPEKNWKFIDVGCALGGNIIALNEKGYEAYGTEISDYCINNSEVKDKIIFGESFNLPHEDNSFDVAICMDIFMYLTKEEIIKSAKELARVAGKYIVFSTIDNGSKNVCQEHNPDNLRKETANLLSKQDYIDIFEKAGTTLFKTDIFPPSWDFSAVFKVN